MKVFEVRGLKKSFGAVKALRGVDLEIYAGEVHALIGENGAGKSTLMKMLSGAEQPDSGEMLLMDQPYAPKHPAQGRASGVAMIYQELNLAPHLSVADNLMLGMEKHSLGFLAHPRQAMKAALNQLGLGELNLDQAVNKLSLATQQLLEIARALMGKAKVVIMDEPTSSLTAEDTQALFRVIRQLKEQGIAVIYISHFLEEVQDISDRFTILRDGESVGKGPMKTTPLTQIIEMMVGRSLDEMYPRLPHSIGQPLLQVKDLVLTKGGTPISFTLHAGEVLGISGLVGAGRSELIRALFGLEPASVGQVEIRGGTLAAQVLTPNRALKVGMDLLSENRKEEGLILNRSIRENITLSGLRAMSQGGFLQLSKELQVAQNYKTQVNIKCLTVEQGAGTLSGGNQQKICLARLMNYNNDILFLDEPTRGIDVGSKAEIYRMIQEMAQQGKAVIMVSSYLPELLGTCDSLAVMYRGQLSPVKAVSAWNQVQVMQYATSGAMA